MTSLWQISVGYQPSYAWKSIWSARDLIEKGIRWKVRDGKNILIWKYAWLNENGTSKVITPSRCLHPDSKVEALINADTGGWKKELIDEVFFPFDVDRINKVLFCFSGNEDERCWVMIMNLEDHATSLNGEYKVRDAYDMIMNLEDHATSSNGKNLMWKKMWKLNIPLMVKYFMWRACWDI